MAERPGASPTSADRRARIGDAAYAIALLAVAGIILREAQKLPPAPFDPLGPGTVPIWICWALIGLALVMLANLAVGRDLGRAQQSMVVGLGSGEAEHRPRPFVAVALFVLTTAYVAALSVRGIGFLIATGVYLFLAGALLSGFARRRMPALAIVAAAMAVALELTFRTLFQLDLP
jgi:putative tricarboxylic transport membrane protein